jgi:hypothetical protein
MAAEQVRILFLAANPRQTGLLELDLDTEYNEMEAALAETDHTERILLQPRWKLSRDQLLDHLHQYRPHIVHFSGHGTEDHLLLQDRNGNPWPLDRATARAAFKTTSSSTRLVVLNACHSRDIAEEVSEVVDCVIGMAQPIHNDTSVTFSSALYRGLGDGLSVRAAFDRARAQIQVRELVGSRTPQIRSRPGLDPRTMFLLNWISGVAPPSSSGFPAGPVLSGFPAGPFDRPQVRKLLDRHLKDNSDFDGFVLDRFPDVMRRYASGMDRIQRTNLLLTLKEPDEVASALRAQLHG